MHTLLRFKVNPINFYIYKLFGNRKVDVVVIHPKFDPKTFEYDLALLKFYEPIEFTSNVIPICTPEADQDFDGKTAWVTGWGRLSKGGKIPSILQEVSLPIINNDRCERRFLEAGYKLHIPYYTFICAGYKKGGKDSCEVNIPFCQLFLPTFNCKTLFFCINAGN